MKVRNMTSGVSYNRYAHSAQIRVRSRILKNFREIWFCTHKYTLVQKISSKYDIRAKL